MSIRRIGCQDLRRTSEDKISVLKKDVELFAASTLIIRHTHKSERASWNATIPLEPFCTGLKAVFLGGSV
jgi:hypothetical protein